MKTGKIFLSHSSADKKYVGYIAEQFGKDRCVYDSLCFEAGMKSIDEIYRELDKTSIFVVFLSDASLNSPWVREELSIADVCTTTATCSRSVSPSSSTTAFHIMTKESLSGCGRAFPRIIFG